MCYFGIPVHMHRLWCLCVSMCFLVIFSLALFLLLLVSPVLNFKEKSRLILFCYYSLYTCLFSIERQNGCGQGTRGREEVGGVMGGKILTKIHCMKNTPFLMEEKYNIVSVHVCVHAHMCIVCV